MHARLEITDDRPGQDTSLSSYIQAVSPHISPDLIAPECFSAMERIAASLPAAMTQHFGFECRLGTPNATADFLLATSVAVRGRELMAGQHPGIPAPDVLRSNSGWERARAFFTDWADPASPLYDGADHVCLEFDLANPEGREAIPNLFFAPQDPAWKERGHARSSGHLRPARDTVDRGIELLTGGTFSRASAAALQRCFNALPPGAWVFHIGGMIARTPAPIRLMFSGLSPIAFLDFLSDVEWSGSTADLEPIASRYAAMTDDIIFAIDLYEGIGPRIGLECYLRDDDAASPLSRWPALLDVLVDDGLCLPSKREALLCYPGITYEANDPGHWPESLARAGQFLGGRSIPVLSRYLHHIKLVFEGGRVTEAKAYPGVALQWITRAS